MWCRETTSKIYIFVPSSLPGTIYSFPYILNNTLNVSRLLFHLNLCTLVLQLFFLVSTNYCSENLTNTTRTWQDTYFFRFPHQHPWWHFLVHKCIKATVKSVVIKVFTNHINAPVKLIYLKISQIFIGYLSFLPRHDRGS